MTTYFTSDVHFIHPRVSQIRGFASPGEHDAAVVSSIRSVVTAHDELFIVGDLNVGRYSEALALAQTLPGTKHLILGNHDVAFPGLRGHHSKLRAALEVFETVQLHDQIRTAVGPVMISHFPYTGDHGPDRFTEWRLRDSGRPIIHGHTHGTEKVTRTKAGTVQVHVGLDAWGLRPVPLATIEELISGGTHV